MKPKEIFSRYIRFHFALASIALVAGCGGGGGGGTSEGANARSGVRIIHGSLDSVPVDLLVNGEPEAKGTVRFGEASVYADVGEGSQRLQMVSKGSTNVVFAGSATISDASPRHSYLLYGQRGSNLASVVIAEEGLLDLTPNQSAVRFINSIDQSDAVSPLVSGTRFPSVPQGQTTGYRIINSGVGDITVESGGEAIVSSTRTFEGGKSYTILLAGEVGYLVLDKIIADD